MQNDLNRRKFIANSAKLGAGLALFSGGLLFASNGAKANLSASANSSANAGAGNSSVNAGGANLGAENSGANSTQMPNFTLNNGILMPATGFGTLKLGDTKATQKAVEQALEAGYRLF